ncbi:MULTISPECIES: hypothetical protein [unclassified Methanosarcina]|nr:MULTISPECIES: hypothetical protein [unclassified Methanosarcina]
MSKGLWQGFMEYFFSSQGSSMKQETTIRQAGVRGAGSAVPVA